MSEKSRLSARRNFGKGRLAYINNNLKTFTSSVPCTSIEAELLNQAVALLKTISDNYSKSNQKLGLDK